MKLKKLIMVIIVLIIILTIILIILLSGQEKPDKVGEKSITNGVDTRDILNPELNESLVYETIEEVKNKNRFYTVVNCINDFLQIVYENDNQKIYNLLSKEYIEKNNITTENILQKVNVYKQAQVFCPEKMYQINNTEDVSTYYAEGIIKEVIYENGTDRIPIETGKKEEFYIAIQLDKVKRTFAVLPNEKVPNKVDIKEMKYKNIAENETNIYESANVTDLAMANVYYEDYIKILNEDINKAYDKLQKEYKEKRFERKEDFELYVKSNKELLENARIITAIAKSDNDTTMYACKDNNGRIYIFVENAILDYTVQLDDYTLENEAFNETYSKANYMNKGLLNCEKFFQMINMQDYSAAYNVLDDNFKQTYFKTQESFEQYVKSHLFRYNKASYEEYNNQISQIHSYKITLSDATGSSQETRQFNIVMKLLEGTDFVMSFEVN